MQLNRGDRVRLTDDAAARLNRTFHKGGFDWHDRRGVLHHITNNRREAVVYWDGRRSADLVAAHFIEPESAI